MKPSVMAGIPSPAISMNGLNRRKQETKIPPKTTRKYLSGIHLLLKSAVFFIRYLNNQAAKPNIIPAMIFQSKGLDGDFKVTGIV